MTINELVGALDGAGKEARLGLASKYLKEFLECGEQLNEQMGGDINFYDLTANIFACGLAADGKLTQDEYHSYVALCDSIGATARDYSTCQNFASAPTQAVDMFAKPISGIKDIFNQVFDEEIFQNLGVALACFLMDDGQIKGEERRLLGFFFDDNGDSAVSESSFSSSSTEDVKIVTYQGDISRKNDRYYFTIGAEIKNPNPEHCARNVSVKVIVKDSSGRILESSENTIDYIDSNATFYYGDEFSIDRGAPANYSIQVNCDDFVGAPENSTFASGITCSHYNLKTDSWGDIEFTGNVHNGYNKKLYIELYFVFYDKAGKITGGTNTRVNLYGNSDDGFNTYLNTNIARENVRCSAAFDFMELMD